MPPGSSFRVDSSLQDETSQILRDQELVVYLMTSLIFGNTSRDLKPRLSPPAKRGAQTPRISRAHTSSLLITSTSPPPSKATYTSQKTITFYPPTYNDTDTDSDVSTKHPINALICDFSRLICVTYTDLSARLPTSFQPTLNTALFKDI